MSMCVLLLFNTLSFLRLPTHGCTFLFCSCEVRGCPLFSLYPEGFPIGGNIFLMLQTLEVLSIVSCQKA